MVVDRLPNFQCAPSRADGRAGPTHSGTVHFESHIEEIEQAYLDSRRGRPASRPVIEMTIPSALDSTLAPPGYHIVQLFVQYAPYDLDPSVGSWSDASFKQRFVDRCLSIVEDYCPGFTSSIKHIDALSALDLEQIFGLYKGNIHHGAISLHQLAYMRPAPGMSDTLTNIPVVVGGNCLFCS